MADQSAQHGQRLDDEMEHEVEGLVRGAPVDARARDDLGFEEIEQSTVPLGDPVEDDRHLAVIQRSEVARFLRPSALPADRDTVLAVAAEERAPDPVLAELAALPPGVRFATVAEIWEALGHETEHRDQVHDDTEAGGTPAAGAEPEETSAPVEGREREEPGADVVSFEPATVPTPAAEAAGDEEEPAVETPPAPAPVAPVAPVPEPPSLGALRGAVVLGLELARAGLGVADRVLEGVERLVSR